VQLSPRQNIPQSSRQFRISNKEARFTRYTRGGTLHNGWHATQEWHATQRVARYTRGGTPSKGWHAIRGGTCAFLQGTKRSRHLHIHIKGKCQHFANVNVTIRQDPVLFNVASVA